MLKLNRATFESLVGNLSSKDHLHLVKTALKDSGIKSTMMITEVILVGGMTRMPKVKEQVEKVLW